MSTRGHQAVIMGSTPVAPGGFDPLSLWPLSTSPGFFLAPWMTASGFQDSAGTIAGAVNQGVGLRLDKRRGATVKANAGNHVEQATSGNRPVLRQSGSLYYDEPGSDAAVMTASHNATHVAAALTFAIAIETKTLGARRDWFASGLSSAFSTNNYIVGSSAAGRLTLIGRTPSAAIDLGALAINTKYVITITTTGTHASARINGVSTGAAQACTLGTDNNSGFYLHGSSSVAASDALLYGLMICPAQSEAVLEQMEDYLAAKIGITL